MPRRPRTISLVGAGATPTAPAGAAALTAKGSIEIGVLHATAANTGVGPGLHVRGLRRIDRSTMTDHRNREGRGNPQPRCPSRHPRSRPEQPAYPRTGRREGRRSHVSHRFRGELRRRGIRAGAAPVGNRDRAARRRGPPAGLAGSTSFSRASGPPAQPETGPAGASTDSTGGSFRTRWIPDRGPGPRGAHPDGARSGHVRLPRNVGAGSEEEHSREHTIK